MDLEDAKMLKAIMSKLTVQEVCWAMQNADWLASAQYDEPDAPLADVLPFKRRRQG